MTARRLMFLACDEPGCEATYSVLVPGNATLKVTRDAARREGWRSVWVRGKEGLGDYCAAHSRYERSDKRAAHEALKKELAL